MSSPALSDHSLPPSPLSPAPELENNPEDEDMPGSPGALARKDTDDVDVLSDNDSVLSDVDEAQFEDFDPNQIAIEERPVTIDEDTVKLLGRHKRKRDGDTDGEGTRKKTKEKKREKPRKARKKKDSDDDDFSGGQELEGKRVRKKKAFSEGGEKARKEKTKARQAPAEDEEQLDPEERRRRALDRAMDAALKNPTKRRRRAGEVDLNAMADEEIANLRIRMAEAAQLDVDARQAHQPAMHKLRLLPEVTALLNRNSRDVESAIVDPENNLLESVRFFLEPLPDGQLPAYNIQRELFASLAKLPVDKEALISSGIGKVVLFYTKSKKPELSIKRAAERLLGEWTRPILKRSDDYRKRALPTAEYDPLAKMRPASQNMSQAEVAAAAREKELAPPKLTNRARVEVERKTYTIVPRSGQVAGGMFARPLGASGEDAFRRMKARQAAAQGKGPKRG
ncbi:hypothetical protein JMJ35_009181 [Cladonia borealis]|uniref:TFIIS N-terminal domain-containing protein n=1 Tax=Cladonia borealis TaxID=184061 RepID=A0AA39QRY2_9LECA|nr:hypothetical protein JMJ35_009181 [Cladonia borealis]